MNPKGIDGIVLFLFFVGYLKIHMEIMTSSVKVAHSRQMISIKNSPPCKARGPNGEGKSLQDHGKNV